MIKLALLGLGHLGKIHARCLHQTSFDVIGFYDPSPSLRPEDYQGLERYDDLDLLLSKVDAVDVVTSTATHFDMIEKAVSYGLHIFVEKPFVHRLAHAYEVQQSLQNKDLVFQIGHVERFNPAYIDFDTQSLNPKFIEGHRLAPFNPRGTDASVILDLMIHDIDIVLDIVKSKVDRVDANGVKVVSDSYDICNARIRFENGCVANLTASRISLKQMRKIRMVQKDAYINIDFLNKETQIFRLETVKEGEDVGDAITLDTAQGVKKVHVESPKSINNNAIVDELSEFYESIKNGTSVRVGIEEGIASIELAAEIYKQVEKNEIAQ